ncbi:surface-anchored protein [Corynebacterium renale]|uniref:SpaH/EbpB family LPXTG-anchored major pilin n=1 Tax=Corynebacterium renale TaxID=1724 RepID=UPI000DA2D719|nr:SpaH/EbpB family LPXTG-anchored major pilin [Corynebacterium renale]SQG63485.1 surface-anchored protein [Corynebacterium renale]STD00352.1 surface-anchored protein [Corynebacterium renale]
MSSRKTLAIALSAGLILSGTAGFGAAESFAQTGGDQTQANEAQYSLTIVKRAGQEETVQDYEGGQIDKEKRPANDPTPGDGFKFKVEKVTPDAKDKENAAAATYVEGDFSMELTTEDDGQVKFENLPAGVYRVTETKVPDDSGFVAGKPFLVSVPYTKKDGTGIISDVFVYPKNTQVGIEKEVVDADKHGGQDYTYVIKSAIPAPATGESLVGYTVEDVLNDQLRKPQTKDVKVKLGTDWKNGADVDPKYYSVTTQDQKVTVTFEEDGLKFLAKNTDKQVLTQITTTAPADIQEIPNKSTLIFDNGSGAGDVRKDSNEVKTYWGKLNIKKVADNGTTPLQGAEFQIVRCEGSGDNYTQVADTQPLTVNRKNKWTTNKNGQLTITGIHASHFENNGDVNPVKTYCAQETKAPTGFKLDKKLIPFVLTAEGKTKFADTDIAKPYEYGLTIKNTSNDRFLPNTGGMGITIIALLSLAVIAGGVLLARRNAA